MNIRVRELGITNLIQACGPATMPFQMCGQATAPFQMCGQITAPIQACGQATAPFVLCPTASAPWVASQRTAIDHDALRAQLRKALGH